MQKSKRKALANLSLIWGLAAEIEDTYKAKQPRDLCKAIKYQADKCMDLWPFKPEDTQKEKQILVHETEAKLLKLQKDLTESPRLTFAGCALITLDHMSEMLKGDKLKEVEKLRQLVLDLVFYIDRGASGNYKKYKQSERVMEFWEV